MKSRVRLLQAIAALLFVVWLLQGRVVTALADYFWFDAMGYSDLFGVTLYAKVGLWLAGAALSSIFIVANLTIATREAPIDFRRAARLVLDRGMTGKQLKLGFSVAVAVWVVLPSLYFAMAFAYEWLEVLTWMHAQDFGVLDPVFKKDIGFYVFKLPAMAHFQTQFAALVGVTALPLVGFYFVRDVFVGQKNGLSDRARTHLLILGALFFVMVSWGWYLDTFELLFERHGVVWGMGYADLNGSLPARWIMVGISLLTTAALLVSTRKRNWRVPTGAFGLYGICWMLLEGVWPGVLQNWYVSPNELDVESPFLQDNILATQRAYALDRIESRPFEAGTNLSLADIQANPLTIDNIRVWDDQPLLSTYGQIQEIRPYYRFVDVDVDRYMFDGVPRQVMLSARELNYAKVENKSWVNQHFQYTHGYGLAMSPVNAVSDRGLPELFVQDIPPSTRVDLEIERPEIYYGEITESYVFTGTTTDEFDYPDGEDNQYNRYAGTGGVPLPTFARKVLFAMHFSSLDILLSNYLTDESRVHFRRRIKQRVQALTPFILLDEDPYLVVADGRLVWVIDAYTYTNKYPYSEPIGSYVNYLRSSVKVVVDAYDGSVAYYVADPTDPIIQVYTSIFQGVFKPMDQMPEAVRAHLRYPMDFFQYQAHMYARYHMNTVGVFYNAEDLWDSTQRSTDGRVQANEPNYLIMKLPGEERAEFVLLNPFVPNKKSNMISWLAARSDGVEKGQLVLYQFPKQKLIFGPEQIEARINQDPEISKEMTLWGQGGSRVTRGDLLVIPIQDSLLYVMPLYLEASSSKLPELKRVVVSCDDEIAMEQTLELALTKLFGEPGMQPHQGGDPDAPVADEDSPWQSLASQASQQYQLALQLQRSGDWAGYGQALEQLERSLADLEGLASPEQQPEQAQPEQPAGEQAPTEPAGE